jgi:hypothetical protein
MVLLATAEQKASPPSLSCPSGTCMSRGGIVVSSVYVRLRSLVFKSMQPCRLRTLTVFSELLSRVLKIGRCRARPR